MIGIKPKLIIYDGHALLHRSFHALPNLKDKSGRPTGAIYGVARTILETNQKYQANYCIVAWDQPGPTFRNQVYPEYKANRQVPDQDLVDQITTSQEVLEGLGFRVIGLNDYEADDLVGSIASQYQDNYRVLIVTGDRDQLQLLGQDVEVLLLRTFGKDKIYTKELFIEEYGFSPIHLIDYKALAGDNSDNIPGVPGIGDKSARDLLTQYQDLEDIIKHLEDLKPRWQKLIEQNVDLAKTSKHLATIITNLHLDLDFNQLDCKHYSQVEAMRVIKQYDLHSLIRLLPQGQDLPEDDSSVDSSIYSLSEGFEDKIKGQQLQGLEQSDFDLVKLVNTNSLPSSGYLVGNQLKALVLKPDSEVVLFDLSLASQIIERNFSSDQIPGQFVEAYKSMKNSNQLIEPSSQVSLFGEEFDWLSAGWDLWEMANRIEWPLIPVLKKMEDYGTMLDLKQIEKQTKALRGRLSEIDHQAQDIAGEEFNLGSVKQLQGILFDKLKISSQGLKRNKTGISLAADQLDKLEGQHPIIDLIRDYRMISKLLNTYLETLPKLADKGARVHTTYNQIGAQTGRLSSVNPNLMNIPTRTELGRAVKSCFIAPEGRRLISVDYSQIDLRVAAILSQDKNLLDAFRNQEDIHRRTASLIYQVPIDQVTNQQRYQAKAINFGVLYGMGAHGLVRTSGIEYQEAEDFIERYFRALPDLKLYLESVKQFVREYQFVDTYFGRRRHFPEINAKSFQLRMASERAAINLPIQGTVADLMKLAMIELDQQLPKQARLIMQIHDELVVEVDQSQVDQVVRQVKQIMEGVWSFSIPLSAGVKVGQNLGEMIEVSHLKT
ncbi:hypothetical protein KA531_01715 [Candidatus Saccharibacteria bacterium]|nr:hypothetical protein [Candidatus Saccharibacteria bacterium]